MLWKLPDSQRVGVCARCGAGTVSAAFLQPADTKSALSGVWKIMFFSHGKVCEHSGRVFIPGPACEPK